PQLKRDPFYESDCLGRTSTSLIAGRSRPEQSAPTACEMRPRGCPGSVAQSASASFSSLELPIRLDDVPARRSRARKPWFYLRRSEEHTSELQSLRHLVCR